MSQLLACLLLALDFSEDLGSMAAWWREHQHSFRLLSDDERAVLIARKDAMKAALS